MRKQLQQFVGEAAAGAAQTWTTIPVRKCACPFSRDFKLCASLLQSFMCYITSNILFLTIYVFVRVCQHMNCICSYIVFFSIYVCSCVLKE